MKVLMLVTLLVMPLSLATAAEIETGEPVAAKEELDSVRLEDGTVLRGRLVSQDEEQIVFDSESLGRLTIPREQVAMLVVLDQPENLPDPDTNTIMFCPTPETLPRGDAYFRNFELFFLNYGYSFHDNVNVSLGTIFPISGDLLMISGGLKVRLLDRGKHPLGLALVGNYTRIDEYNFGAVGMVAGVGDHRRSLNFFVNRAFDDDGDAETLYFLGADVQASGQSKLLLEFFSNSPVIGDWDDDGLNGFVNVGIRLYGENYSWNITGFRPLWEENSSSLWFWPMVMFSLHF